MKSLWAVTKENVMKHWLAFLSVAFHSRQLGWTEFIMWSGISTKTMITCLWVWWKGAGKWRNISFFFACTHPKYVIIFVCSKHWVICNMLLQSYDRELFVIVHMGFTEKFSVTQVFHLLLLLGSQKSQWGGGGQGCHKGSLNVASGLPASCNTVCYCYLHWSH